ncbi:MAG: O-antigen ligase family protein [Candidatus Omnitrophica bacterium]|nr:O-antigen ligase family protein [Candidatus Omnitrophota bacterium]
MAEKIVSRLIESFLIFLIIFSPLFYGSLLALPLSIIQLISLLILSLFLLKITLVPSSKIILPSAISLMAFFLLLVVFQLLPLPSFLATLFSPKGTVLTRAYLGSTSLFNLSQITIYPFNTKQELIKYICFFSIFFVSLNTIQEKKQFERLFSVIIVWAAILCLYGIIQRYFVLERIDTSSFSVFGNKNYFAGYMCLIAPLAIGYTLACHNHFKKITFGFLSALISASVFISLSRAASLSLVLSFFIFLLLLATSGKNKAHLWGVLVVALLALGLVTIVGFEALRFHFLLFEGGLRERLSLSADALGIVKDFPVMGVGLGNFHLIFTIYKISTIRGFFYNLHNDHLQLIIETGLLGAFFYFSFLFKIFKDTLTHVKLRQDPFVKNIAIGGLCGCWGLLVHSFADFNFHIPATVFLFWLILGLINKCVYVHFR